MLDVHPPHQKMHGAGDFFLHLLTITVGLLIALGLEAGVEAVHHRHQRREAEATIREELVENQKTLDKVQRNTREEITNLKQLLSFLEDLRDGKKDDPRVIQLPFNSEPLHNAAWQTANSTGALTYMDYTEAQRFAVAYHLQDLYDASVARGFEDYEMLHSYFRKDTDPLTLSQQDIQAAISETHRALADLNGMADWGRGVSTMYHDTLK